MNDVKTCSEHGEVVPRRAVPIGRMMAHLILTLLTCGVWVVPWIADSLVTAAFPRCPICGGPVG